MLNIESLLNMAAFQSRSVLPPYSWCGHMPFGAWLVRTLAPKILVELGTHTGNSYFTFCQSAAESGLQTKCFAVDTWRGDDHATFYEDDVFERVAAHNREHYAGFSTLMRTTFDEAAADFQPESIDLLHIDGLHTYEAVRHDFQTWLPRLAPGAVVLFHDISVREQDFGVWRLWMELRERYPRNFEFEHSHGLGVLQLSNPESGGDFDLLDPECTLREMVRDYFAALGRWHLERAENIQSGPAMAYLQRTREFEESIKADWAARGRAMADMAAHIRTLEADWAARGERIAGLVEFNRGLENRLEARRFFRFASLKAAFFGRKP
ncbi:class I SAM-dependent methyltransferase [Desulfonatronum thioautotrophicum]|uniref:class I SAM-dependent methyltransferase n=1 Tax=Desulfonatronum thioautotrophicum TaxID=617001 RepID=UPI000699ED26|nr:class I SAM-dependent methyltransferase [Desulfonatronum thioautotrophicum]